LDHVVVFGERGCTGFACGPDRWQHHCQAAPGRIASPVRPDLISGRDRWLGPTVKVDWPILTNLRLDPYERTGMFQRQGQRFDRLLQLVRIRVLAFRVRSTGRREGSAVVHRLPADAGRGEFQHVRSQGGDRESHRRPRDRQIVSTRRVPLQSSSGAGPAVLRPTVP
jgi:hypothetical protein